jgi:hypothetical protein
MGGCPYRKSNPHVLMVQSTKHRIEAFPADRAGSGWIAYRSRPPTNSLAGRHSAATLALAYRNRKEMVGTTNKSIAATPSAEQVCGAHDCARTSSSPATAASPAHHILGNAGLAGIDAKPEQFAMDPGSAPQRVGDAHLPD